MWQASAGTRSRLGLQGAERELQGAHLLGENCQGQWILSPPLPPCPRLDGCMGRPKDLSSAFLTLAVYENHVGGRGV